MSKSEFFTYKTVDYDKISLIHSSIRILYQKMDFKAFINEVAGRKDIGDVVYKKIIPAKSASYGTLNKPLPKELNRALLELGIEKLYTHQTEAIDKIREDKHTAVMTPTSSGKSFIYNIPVLESILNDNDSHALYLFPLKGLTQDQFQTFSELGDSLELHNHSAIYDGDTSSYKRGKIRSELPNVVFTNPDMLHLGILAFHEKWSAFFSNLKYVVIDELHTYRGVLGSHSADLIRRLRRVCELYGSKPVFITCSATIANPKELAETLTGVPFEIITGSGAPRGKKNFIFVNPIPEVSPYTASVKLFLECIKHELKTIAFTKSRKITELLYKWAVRDEPSLTERISTYRAGYLAEERREIEEALFSDKLSGVISTSALELGVDIGGLDACVLVGYPGTISSTLQRAGRVGRSENESIIFMVAIEDALDQHFMRRPEEFFRKSAEAAVLDEENEYILKQHLNCAVSEIPLSIEKEDIFNIRTSKPLLDDLVLKRKIRYTSLDRSYYPRRKNPHREVSIRGGGAPFRILLGDEKILIGESGSSRVLKELHPGAVYLHRGSQYLVKGIHLAKNEVHVKEVSVDYYTSPITDDRTDILEIEETKKFREYGFTINRGKLMITEHVLGFRRKDIYSRKLISEHLLELPPNEFKTSGVWIEVEDWIMREISEAGFGPAGGLHALEHTAIAALPLYALCDRRDLGGVSYFPVCPELGVPAIFIYDGHEGGVGLTKRGFEVAPHWFNSTLEILDECPCEKACPACTQDPHCGNNNEPLDKRAAQLILKHWLRKND